MERNAHFYCSFIIIILSPSDRKERKTHNIDIDLMVQSLSVDLYQKLMLPLCFKPKFSLLVGHTNTEDLIVDSYVHLSFMYHCVFSVIHQSV